MEILTKAVLGGLIIAVIALLARTGETRVAGLIVLFPVVALVSYYFVGASEGAGRLRGIVRASILAVPVWLVFMAVVYAALSAAVDYRLALACGLVGWLIAAGIFLLVSP
jgi:membrane protein GlpM